MDLGNILSAGVTEWIKELFARVFGDNAALATVLLSSVPTVVLKGAFPCGRCSAFWGVHALSGGAALAASRWVENLILSILLAVWGASSLWGIGELFEQRERVAKGWFPNREKKNRRGGR